VESLTGRLSAIARNDLDRNRVALTEEINRVIKPARHVTPESVYIGVLLAASDQVNAQGGCFARAELAQLADLVVDAPVMIGHKKDELPIGRVFKGEIIDHCGTPWLRAYFYWHRDQARAEEIKTGIEAGIYKECSLGFLYAKPECGICRGDMRSCRHRVNEVVRLGGRDIRAFYYYKQLERVLEISLVYRGAVAGTSVSTLRLPAERSSGLSVGTYCLRKENSRSALLCITIGGETRCLRLLNFQPGGARDGRQLLCESVDPATQNDFQLILDYGKVKLGKRHANSLEFTGSLLRGSYRIEQKEDE
jgi:hypothetical protein